MPVFCVFVFLFVLANSGTPLTVNFVGEFISLLGLFNLNSLAAVFISWSVVLSAAFSLWLYIRIVGGKPGNNLRFIPDINRRETHSLNPLLGWTLMLGIVPLVILDILHINTYGMLFSDISMAACGPSSWDQLPLGQAVNIVAATHPDIANSLPDIPTRYSTGDTNPYLGQSVEQATKTLFQKTQAVEKCDSAYRDAIFTNNFVYETTQRVFRRCCIHESWAQGALRAAQEAKLSLSPTK